MKERIRSTIEKIRENHLVARFSMIKDYVFAGIKIAIGLFTSSFFFWISAIFSICIGFARSTYLTGIRKSGDNEAKQYSYYVRMALFILLGSIIYVIYMARLFFIPSNFNYDMIPSIAIAAVSFTELVLSIKNIIKAKDILQKGLRCVSLTCSFTAIVLTQVALLSFSNTGEIETAAFFNAVSGCTFGGLCILIGLAMLFKYGSYKKKSQKQNSRKNNEL